MNEKSNKNYYFIIIGCIFTYSIYLVFEYIFTNGSMGVPLDDTWIHFQYADNFTKGYFYHYNPGEPAAGTTSPFYVIVLAGFSYIIKNFMVNSIFVSAVFHLLSCIFIYKISLNIFQNNISPLKSFHETRITPEFMSLIVALLTVFAGRFAWSALSGMETTMFTFFCIMGIYFHIKNLQKNRFTLLPSIFFSLATVSRPEGYLLSGLYFLDTTLNLLNQKVLKKNLLKLILSILIFILITFPYLIFSYNISGNFFPNTFRGQGGRFNFIPDFNYLRISTILFFRDNFLVALLYLSSIVFYFLNLKKYFAEFQYLNLIFLWTVSLPLLSSILVPNWRHHGRYLIPLIPFVNIIAMYIILNLLNKSSFARFKKYVLEKKIILASILIVSWIYYIVYAIALGKNTGNINDQQVKLANWVKDNVARNETIAINDIGAITFMNKNRIIDMAGLVTPEFLRYRTYTLKDNLDSMNSLLKKNNVKYIIIYDEWFKEYVDEYKNTLTFITSAILEENTICGGNEMKVYKTNF